MVVLGQTSVFFFAAKKTKPNAKLNSSIAFVAVNVEFGLLGGLLEGGTSLGSGIPLSESLVYSQNVKVPVVRQCRRETVEERQARNVSLRDIKIG